MSDCATCGELGPTVSANTGRQESLPPAASKLRRLWGSTGNNAFDALQCPACGAWFEWRDQSSWTGSGNDDSESLERLPLDAWAFFERLLHGEVTEEPAALVQALFSSTRWRELYLRALSGLSEEAREALVPALVERLVTTRVDSENHTLYAMLHTYSGEMSNRTSRRRECERLTGFLRAERARGRLAGRAKYLLELCEVALGRP